MAYQGDMVERLQPVVEAHRGRRQAPVRFRPATWRPWLEPYGVTHVLGLGVMDATSTSGDRAISRMTSLWRGKRSATTRKDSVTCSSRS